MDGLALLCVVVGKKLPSLPNADFRTSLASMNSRFDSLRSIAFDRSTVNVDLRASTILAVRVTNLNGRSVCSSQNQGRSGIKS
jgi:hypothetical protein